MRDSRSVRLEFFDACRGIAALSVFLLHFGNFRYGMPLMASAYLGVDLFFLLSGFVIAYAFEPRLRDGLGTGRFMAIRLRRLYPLFALGLFASFAFDFPRSLATGASLGAGLQDLGRFASSLAGIPDLTGGYLYPLNPVFWSLGLEILLNLLHGLLLVRLATPVLVVVATAAAGILCWTAASHGGLDVGYDLSTAGGGLARIVFAYTTGIVLARTAVVAAPTLPAGLAPVLLLVLVALLVAQPPVATRGLFDWTVAVLVMPCLLLLGTRIALPRLLRPPLLAGGRLSYPLYTLHAPVFLTVHALAQGLPASAVLPEVAIDVAIVLATLAIAAFASRLEPHHASNPPATTPRPAGAPCTA